MKKSILYSLSQALVLLTLVTCSSERTDLENKEPLVPNNIENTKRNIKHLIIESEEICRTIECQTNVSPQAVVYSDLYKDLHKFVLKFADTNWAKLPANDVSLKQAISDFQVQYHSRLDDAIKSVKYELFPVTDTFFVYASFFKIDTTQKEYPDKYYFSCINILNEHLKIMKIGRPIAIQDSCKINLRH